MPRIRYSEEVRQQALALVLESHLSAAQVAREIGCSVNSIHGWIKQHRQKDRQPTDQQSKATFVPVNIIDAKHQLIEIVTPNGFILRLNETTPQYLVELLNALATC